jgi:hypothetical protein
VNAFADNAVLGICEMLGLLFGLPFGEDLYHDKLFSEISAWHWFYLAVGIFFAGAGFMFPWLRRRTWVPERLSASLSRATLGARVSIVTLLLLFVYLIGTEIYMRAEAPKPLSGSTGGHAGGHTALSTRRIEDLSSSERVSLSRELYKLKPLIPDIYLSESLVGVPSHDRSVFSQVFSKAGIRPGTTFQELEGPDQSGLLICVTDVNRIPEKVKQLAQVLGDFGIQTNYAPLVPSRISSSVPPQIGFVLFVGPK